MSRLIMIRSLGLLLLVAGLNQCIGTDVVDDASHYSAFNNRTNGFSDEFRYGAKIGLSLDRLALQLSGDGVKSFKNGDANFNSEGTGLYSNNAEYLALTPLTAPSSLCPALRSTRHAPRSRANCSFIIVNC